jgi:ABC-type sugar transport system ATPase subunit
MVEIAKALALDARLVVMDEPTSALTENEVLVLLDLVRRLRERGVAVVYVSHRFREVFAVADRITVLRDGKLACPVLHTAETTPDTVVSRMVGREVLAIFGDHSAHEVGVNPVVSVRGLRSAPRVKDVSFDLFPGEILGVAGLVGAGRSESVRAIFGVDRIQAGEVRFEGRVVHWRSPRQAIAAGVALVPEDRKGQALFLGLPVRSTSRRPARRWSAGPVCCAEARSVGWLSSTPASCGCGAPRSTSRPAHSAAATSRRWCSPGGWPCVPRCCCWTSRLEASTSARRRRSTGSSGRSRHAAWRY